MVNTVCYTYQHVGLGDQMIELEGTEKMMLDGGQSSWAGLGGARYGAVLVKTT